VLGVPQVPVRVIVAMKILLGARLAGGEANGAARGLLSYPVAEGPRKSILGTQDELLRDLGIESAGPAVPILTLSAGEKEWAAAELTRTSVNGAHPLIGLHATAEKAYKRWPAEHFGNVIAALRAQFPRLGVISFGAITERAEADAARQVASAAPWFEGTGAWTLRQTASLIQRCDLLVGGDTGLMHIAAAVGTRTVTVFGSTSPERLAPPGLDHAWVKPDTPCHPCYGRRGYQECCCIRTIPSDEVESEVLGMLRR